MPHCNRGQALIRGELDSMARIAHRPMQSKMPHQVMFQFFENLVHHPVKGYDTPNETSIAIASGANRRGENSPCSMTP
ncbi:MAG: hypothetical protein MUF23_11010 [Pirellula sp.]|jgi:hypothetical protein|nr:hypothetical protein [Pirellula sp.]